MSNEVNSDLLDEGLQSVMGKDRCQNEWTAPKKKQKDEHYPDCLGTLEKDEERTKVLDGSWAPVKSTPNQMEKVKICAKWLTLFGGLCLLLFYWQQTGQMLSSAAVPSMVACAALGGFKVGSVCRK